MKKLLIVLIISFGFLYTYSQNLIAIHQNGNVFFETSLDSALAKTNHGDTVYLPGGYI
ncbi:MAG: hypothetical protein U9R42_05110 [Bacteroidota bacterium]|nr:hypothetical protein [Bacteroidota bacterium]